MDGFPAPCEQPISIAFNLGEKGSFCYSKWDYGDFLHPVRGVGLLLRTVRGMDGFPAPSQQTAQGKGILLLL